MKYHPPSARRQITGKLSSEELHHYAFNTFGRLLAQLRSRRSCRTIAAMSRSEFSGWVSLCNWSRFLAEKLTVSQATRKFARVLWTTKAHYCFQNSPPLFPIVSQMMSLFHGFWLSEKVNLNIIISNSPVFRKERRTALCYRPGSSGVSIY